MPDFALIHFEHIYVLGFILIFIACHFICPIRSQSFYFAHLKVFSEAKQAPTSLQTFLKFTAIGMLFVAMASPFTSKHIDITPKKGYDIALLLDGSLSMRAQGFSTKDFRLTRFDAVKNIVGDFIKQRTNDNLGVVMFGEYAFIAAPLTYDKTILKDIVSRLQIGMAGKNTAIYDALGQGINLLKKSKSKEKIAILLTDGRNTAFNVNLEDVLSLAKKYKVKIYTIGIGQPQDIDQNLLGTIASKTGAKMFTATNSDTLKNIYKEINSLEKSEIKSKQFESKKYYFQYPLALSFISILLFLILRQAKGLL